MDGHLAALPFASKAFNTFSEVREKLYHIPRVTQPGQDRMDFGRVSDTLPKQLCCKAEDVPVAHGFPSFVSHILVYLSPEKHNAFQHQQFISSIIFCNGGNIIAVLAVPEYYSISP